MTTSDKAGERGIHSENRRTAEQSHFRGHTFVPNPTKGPLGIEQDQVISSVNRVRNRAGA